MRLPDSYILYHGPCHPVALRTLLESFGWAAGPVGENYPLLILGMDDVGRENLPELLAEYSLESCVRALPVISPYSVLRLYQNCSALFHPTEITPWGNPLRNAIACGKPVVAGETTLSDALVGPAGYLVALGHPRELGAALLTVIVEEGVANQLSAAALRHAAGWKTGGFSPGIGRSLPDSTGWWSRQGLRFNAANNVRRIMPERLRPVRTKLPGCQTWAIARLQPVSLAYPPVSRNWVGLRNPGKKYPRHSAAI